MQPKNFKEYAFVIDNEGKKLSPTSKGKAYALVRDKRAKWLSFYPLTIQLFKVVPEDDLDDCTFTVGIDDGSKNVGLSIVQHCKTRDKVVFKAVINLRADVSKKLEERRTGRRNRRKYKRSRKCRFNRVSSIKPGCNTPSIKQKKDSILRVINKLNKTIRIDDTCLEDVAFDVRCLTDGFIPYNYQKSNRLDSNLRIAIIMRDGKCRMCNKKYDKYEIHHIISKRDGGNSTLKNLITLCEKCHDKTEGKENKYVKKFQRKIKGKNVDLRNPMFVMQGKTYLRNKLSEIADLSLTTGADTSNRRIDNNIYKSHSNDAVVITGCDLTDLFVDLKEWIITPNRRKQNRLLRNKGTIETGSIVKCWFNKYKRYVVCKVRSKVKNKESYNVDFKVFNGFNGYKKPNNNKLGEAQFPLKSIKLLKSRQRIDFS
jgi:5-methylcytosine-specific restriction endonuclease McrA